MTDGEKEITVKELPLVKDKIVSCIAKRKLWQSISILIFVGILITGICTVPYWKPRGLTAIFLWSIVMILFLLVASWIIDSKF